MKSPFPGMDPYLEQHWLDMHSRLVVYACDQLQEQLPADLKARVEERVFVEPDEGDEIPRYHPDVRIAEPRPRRPAGGDQGAAGAALAEPVLVPFAQEKIRQGYIEIVDGATGNRVVTVIEFLSPSNKTPGEGRDQYAKKQADMRKSKANFVEIDLTRRGERRLLLTRVPARHRTTFSGLRAPRREPCRGRSLPDAAGVSAPPNRHSAPQARSRRGPRSASPRGAVL